MSPARMTMMTEDDIQKEFGWNGDMIYSLLQVSAMLHLEKES